MGEVAHHHYLALEGKIKQEIIYEEEGEEPAGDADFHFNSFSVDNIKQEQDGADQAAHCQTYFEVPIVVDYTLEASAEHPPPASQGGGGPPPKGDKHLKGGKEDSGAPDQVSLGNTAKAQEATATEGGDGLSCKEPADSLGLSHQKDKKQAEAATGGSVQKPKRKRIRKSLKGVFPCSECGKTYSTVYSLRDHKTIHSGTEPFQCEVCHKKFTQKKHYNKHMAIHKQIKNFECHVCSKRFLFSGHLKAHLHSHSEEKQFQCDICTKKFTLPSNLKAHRQRHALTEKQFQCEVCHKKFSRLPHLKDHTLLHGERPHKCHICTRSFTTELHLEKHLAYHTRERTLQCSLCPRKFSRTGDLKRHQQSHSGDKPFHCSLCYKQFSLPVSLQRHLFATHKGAPSGPLLELEIEVDDSARVCPTPSDTEVTVKKEMSDQESGDEMEQELSLLTRESPCGAGGGSVV